MNFSWAKFVWWRNWIVTLREKILNFIHLKSHKGYWFFKFFGSFYFSNYFILLISFDLSVKGRPRTAATFKMERFVIIVNGLSPLFIITNCSILDISAVLDPPLNLFSKLIRWNVKQFLPFHATIWKMIKHTRKIMRCDVHTARF